VSGPATGPGWAARQENQHQPTAVIAGPAPQSLRVPARSQAAQSRRRERLSTHANAKPPRCQQQAKARAAPASPRRARAAMQRQGQQVVEPGSAEAALKGGGQAPPELLAKRSSQKAAARAPGLPRWATLNGRGEEVANPIAKSLTTRERFDCPIPSVFFRLSAALALPAHQPFTSMIADARAGGAR